MKRIARLLVALLRQLWSLLVDDGFLAVAALISIGVAYLLSRDAALGPMDGVGWVLIGLIATSTVISVRRAIAVYERSSQAVSDQR